MNIEELVLKALKPKVASFGFSKNEIKSAAAAIANNLEIEENATEEEATAIIEKSVGASLPFFKLAQAASTRVIDAYKAKQKEHDDDDDDDVDDDGEGDNGTAKKANQKSKKSDEQPVWAKAMMAEFQKLSTITSGLLQEKTITSRKTKLEALLKDSGTFGKTVLKNFGRMSFENDEQFEEYLEEVKTDLEAAKKEMSQASLASMQNKPNPLGDDGKLSKEQLESIAAVM